MGAYVTEARSPRGGCRNRALRALGDLPPFSPILNRLLATLAQDDISFARLGDLIEKDTVVAGNILRLVNSALYGRQGTINSVRHAITLLGINKLRNAVLGMSITRMWNDVRTPPGWSMARFNLHSVSTAILADLLAQRLPVDYPEGAFAAGLFHDVGRLLIALGLREEHGQILQLYAESGQSMIECEQEVIGVTHPELSVAAMVAWNLPRPIQTAVELHHRPPEARDELELAHVVYAADQFVNASGTSVIEMLSPADAPVREALDDLEIGDRLPRVLEEFSMEFESLAPFFR